MGRKKLPEEEKRLREQQYRADKYELLRFRHRLFCKVTNRERFLAWRRDYYNRNFKALGGGHRQQKMAFDAWKAELLKECRTARERVRMARRIDAGEIPVPDDVERPDYDDAE